MIVLNIWMGSLGRLTNVFLSLFLWCGLADGVFLVEHGQKVTSSADQVESLTKAGMSNIMCAVFCHKHSNCDLYHYTTVTNVCTIFSQKPSFYPAADATPDADWSLGYIHQHLRSGDWTLAFRAQKRIGVAVYQTWMDSSLHDDHPLSSDFPQACLSLTDYSQCDRHFRSSILDTWGNIKEVKYSLVKNNVEVRYIVFNGIGTNMRNWFKHHRILHSSWTPNLESDTRLQAMSIEGFCHASCRRFHVHEIFYKCYQDYFYTFVIDADYDNCNKGTLNWDLIDTTTFPIFLYAPGSTPATYGIYGGSMDRARQADVLSIWVKFA